jgi:hypothetical protein
LYEDKRHQYWRRVISENQEDMKKLWQTFARVTGSNSSNEYPSAHTPDSFADFFKEKVDVVRNDTSGSDLPVVPPTATHSLNSWEPVTPEEVADLIKKSPSKSCRLDPIPTKILKMFATMLSPFISMLFNVSLSAGVFPQKYKHAVVRPLLKKENLDASQLKNYRPVSNLTFLSKLLEKIVQKRLQSYLLVSGVTMAHQSAYRRFHSTETALIKLYSDLLLAADRGEISALCLLDMSAAFDTVDHDILIRRLENRFGISGSALGWFRSYLTDRSFEVSDGDSSSKKVQLVCSVPQGSVLGPLLFVLYIDELVDIAKSMGLEIHIYADDTQLYIHFKPSNTSVSVSILERGIRVIEQWLSSSRLRLNTDKTELLWLGTDALLRLLEGMGPVLKVGSSVIEPSHEARLLGVAVTPDLSLNRHVSLTTSRCFYQLRQLKAVRHCLDADSLSTLVHAFVSSRVDYCCSLLVGSPRIVTDKLQRVLNAAARLITGTRKYDHGLTELLHDQLHWLDMSERIKFRVAVFMYNSLHGMAPGYLVDMCKFNADCRYNLRRDRSDKLVIPRTRLRTFGDRAFAVAGPTLWNSLPSSLRDLDLSVSVFKRSLKTFFFSSY